LRAISWGYKYRGTIKKAWNEVNSGAKRLGNMVKGWRCIRNLVKAKM